MTSDQIAQVGLYTQIALLIIQIPTLVALILYVIKTWEMASATRKASEIAERTLQELKEARDQEIAPHVVAYFEVPNDDRQLYLVIKNIGKSMATDVKINFDPSIVTPYPEMLERVMPKDGIPSLPPNYEIKTLIDSFPKYKASGPMVYTVELIYHGGISSEPRTAKYVLNLWLHRGVIYAKEA